MGALSNDPVLAHVIKHLFRRTLDRPKAAAPAEPDTTYAQP